VAEVVVGTAAARHDWVNASVYRFERCSRLRLQPMMPPRSQFKRIEGVGHAPE